MLMRLACDWPRCPAAAGVIGEKESVDREARIGGWLLADGGYDLCPLHAPARDEFDQIGLPLPFPRELDSGPLGPNGTSAAAAADTGPVPAGPIEIAAMRHKLHLLKGRGQHARSARQ
jgi:hypothetical protein